MAKNPKKNKANIWHTIQSIVFQSLRILMNLKNYHFMYKKLNDLKKINKLKTVDPRTDENKVLRLKVLDGAGDLFNELYYIYKDKYNEEKMV